MTSKSIARALGATVAALLTTAALATAALAAVPPLTGRVMDGADELSPAAEAKLTGELAGLEAKTGRQFVVVTIASLDGRDIEEVSREMMNTWGVGAKNNWNGLLFVVAPNDGVVRIHIGCGLDEVLSDALASQILDEDAIPRFEKGDIEGGTVAATEALIAQLELPDAEAAARSAKAGPPDAEDEYCKSLKKP